MTKASINEEKCERNILTEVASLGFRAVRASIRKTLREHGTKAAVNMARNLAQRLLREAGLDVRDNSSVHADAGKVSLRAEYGPEQEQYLSDEELEELEELDQAFEREP